MAQIITNIDQGVKRQVEAVLEVYGQTMEETIQTFLTTISATGKIPTISEKKVLTAEEEDALLDKVNAEIYTETVEEFMESLEQACREMDEGKGGTMEEFHENMVAEFPFLRERM